MEFSGTLSLPNRPAIFIAAIAAFVIGGIWYSIFEKSWVRANRIIFEFLKQRKLLMVFADAFIFSLLIAFNLAMFVVSKSNALSGMLAGFLAWFDWAFFAIAIISRVVAIRFD